MKENHQNFHHMQMLKMVQFLNSFIITIIYELITKFSLLVVTTKRCYYNTVGTEFS